MSAIQNSLFEFIEVSEQKTKLRLVPTVAKKAGFKKFAQLKGRSGKDYVFAAVKPDNVCQYDKAVFACSDESGKKVFLWKKSQHKNNLPTGARLYMHILRDKAIKAKIINDLF